MTKNKEEKQVERSVSGQRIEQARKRKGLNQSELAEQAGISRASVSLYETGTGKPSHKILLRLAEALDVKATDLTGVGNGNPARFMEIKKQLSYANGLRCGLIEKHLAREEHYVEVDFYGKQIYLEELRTVEKADDVPQGLHQLVEWPSVAVLALPGIDYKQACVGIVVDNSMHPRYPEWSRHVLHPILEPDRWRYLTGLYGFSIQSTGLIIRRITANNNTCLTLVDADNNELTVQTKDVSMIWRIGQTVHMPPES